MAETLTVVPSTVAGSGSFDIVGTWFTRNTRVRISCAAAGYLSGYIRPARDGTFKRTITAPVGNGSYTYIARYQTSGATVASAVLTVSSTPHGTWTWNTLQEAIDGTLAGGVIDATGQTFTETVTIQKKLTIKGGTINGSGTREQWVRVWAGEVVLDGMTFLNAKAGAYQTGSIDVSAPAFQLRNSSVSGGCYAGVRLWPGATDAKLINNTVTGCIVGVLGYQCHRALVQGGRLHHNTGSTDVGNESGGLKVGDALGVVIDGVESDNNTGPGLWFDAYCDGGTIQNCRTHHNTRSGIMYEIGNGCTITGNTVSRNGTEGGGSAYEMRSGIFASSSKNVKITNNIVAWNSAVAADISFVSQPRTPPAYPHDGNLATGNVLRAAVQGVRYYTDWGDPNVPVMTPNILVGDTDSRISGL